MKSKNNDPKTLYTSLQSNCESIFIKTLDGTISKIDVNQGKVSWTIQTGGKLYDSYNTDTEIFLSSDGNVFLQTENGNYEKQDPPIDDQAVSHFATKSGRIYSSSKSTDVYIIDEETGIIQSLRSINKSNSYDHNQNNDAYNTGNFKGNKNSQNKNNEKDYSESQLQKKTSLINDGAIQRPENVPNIVNQYSHKKKRFLRRKRRKKRK